MLRLRPLSGPAHGVRGCALGLILVFVGACGGEPSVPPSGPLSEPTRVAPTDDTAPAASSDQAFQAFRSAVRELAPRIVGLVDVRGDQRNSEFGLRASLGLDADQILAVASAAEAAAAAKPIARRNDDPAGTVVLAVARAPAAPAPVDASAAVPPASAFLRFLLPPTLDGVGRQGSGSQNVGPVTVTATEDSGGYSAATEMSSSWNVSIQGSSVRMEFTRDVHTVVTDRASGASVLDAARHHVIDAEINVCPTATGIVDASVHNTVDAEASTFAGGGGRVGTHATGSQVSTSAFRGQVDDEAMLGNVSQDYSHEEQWKRTASAEGGPEASHEGAFGVNESGIQDGVPAAREWSLSLGDHSGASGTVHLSGDATQADIASTALSAAEDYTAIDASFIEAERLWRHGRCVMVRSPTYDAETPLEANLQDSVEHTEEVEKGSTTEFDAELRHRFGGTVAASIEANLATGKESLEPDSIPNPPATLTYTAPDEDGKEASVRLVSTSKQGIGTLYLAFQTGAKKLKVTIDGKLTSRGYGVKFVTTVSVPEVVLSKLDDGTYAGSGSLTTKVTIAGICPTPFTETGTIRLVAIRPTVESQALGRPWKVRWDESGKVTTSGRCLGYDIGSLLQLGGAGYTGMFMTVLGDLEFNPEGGTLQVKRSMALGASQNTIVATAKAEIVSDSGP